MKFIQLFILVIALGTVGIFFYLKYTDEKQQKEAKRSKQAEEQRIKLTRRPRPE